MKRAAWLLLFFAFCSLARAASNEDNPHWMLTPEGEADEEKCAICHDEDKNLLSSKEETCLSCHDRTLHSGSAEHLRATAAEVQRLLPAKNGAGVEFPVAEDGRMYCGTCHLVHDPRIDEVTLAAPRTLPSGGLAAAIREQLTHKIQAVLATLPEGVEVEWSFAPQSTGFLRLPLAGNELCSACHAKEGGGK